MLWIGAASAVLLLATPIGATSCKQWNRLDSGGKTDTATGMIQSAIYGNAAQRYSIPKPEIERCAMGKLEAITLEIDDVCSDARTADKQAPRRTILSHIRGCVGERPR
jgi:hypothetical protein